jgi:hypothetical protein
MTNMSNEIIIFQFKQQEILACGSIQHHNISSYNLGDLQDSSKQGEIQTSIHLFLTLQEGQTDAMASHRLFVVMCDGH